MSYAALRSRASLAALLAGIGSAALADTPQIVADTSVSHALTAIVTQGVLEPTIILDRGADPHHFAMRPSQARAVAQADLAIWMGPEMTPWMGRAVEGLGAEAQLQLLHVDGLSLQGYLPQRLTGAAAEAAEEFAHSHDHDHGHSHDHDHGHDHGHHHGAMDPHAWMRIDNAGIWLDSIANRLAEMDPANAETYRANAAAGRAQLVELRAEIEGILAPVGDAGLVMYHDAYGYLAADFGLNILGTIALGDAAAPGAARLSAIRASLEDSGAVCIFPEVNHADAFVNLVAEGGSLRIGAPLDPEGVMLEPGPELYATLMRQMAQTIADCVTEG